MSKKNNKPVIDMRASENLFYRDIEIRSEHIDEENRTVKFTGSSEFEAMRFGYTEILSHEPGHVRMDRIKKLGAILSNHNPNLVVAAIVSVDLVDGRIEVVAKFTTTQRGEDAFIEVKAGAVRGISVGYIVHKWEIDEENNIYKAVDWEPYEFSLTAIPVDPTVGIGRSEDEQKKIFLRSINRTSKPEANTMDDDKKTGGQGGPAPDDIKGQRSAEPKTKPAPAPEIDVDAIQKESAKAVREDITHITRQAESLDLTASDYISLSRSEAADKMLADIADRDSDKETVRTGEPSTITEDMIDKRADHFADELFAAPSMRVFRELVRANGGTGFDDQDIINQILQVGKYKGRALETAASLGNVTILAADKAIIKGFNSYQPWGQNIANVRIVPDFKDVHSAGLTLGAFTVPGEGSALSDLSMDDFGDTGSVAFRGGILQLTEEAIWNDDLGIFFRNLNQLGFMGRREEDKVLITALEAATFSGGSAGTAAFTAGNLKTSWTSFNAITDASGELLGIDPMFILLPPALYIAGLEETTTALGEATNRIFASGEQALQPINGRGLTDANDWYLIASPNAANGLDLLKHVAYPNPKLLEIDPGTTIARKWQVKYPLGGMINNYKAGAPAGMFKNAVA